MLYHKVKIICFTAFCLVIFLSGLESSIAAPSLSLSWYKNNGYGLGTDIGGEWTINTNVSTDVVRVEFYLDDVLHQNDTVAPFSWNFNTADNYTLGAHTFRVVAFDSAGASATAVAERNFVEYSFSSIVITIIIIAVAGFSILLIVSWVWIKKKSKPDKR